MRPETEARYRAATDRKYGEAFSDVEWKEMLSRFEQKRSARAAVAKAVQSGDLVKMPCAMNGCTCQIAEAHHPDYSLPTTVVWLCRDHHAKEHATYRRMTEEQFQKRRRELIKFAMEQGRRSVISDIMRAFFGGEIPEFVNDDDFPLIRRDPPEVQETFIEYDDDAVRGFEEAYS